MIGLARALWALAEKRSGELSEPAFVDSIAENPGPHWEGHHKGGLSCPMGSCGYYYESVRRIERGEKP